MSAQIASATTYARMSERELDEVAEIERAVHAHPWTRGNFADSLAAGYHCWVARRDDVLVGYGVVVIAADEAHLLNLSVAPGWQRRGIGTELARFCVKLSRDYGAEKIYLEVRPSNAAARALYSRHGFTEIGLRRDYYPAGSGREDAIVMELELK
jgi:[ribosomal protein S18]-alanine N-acetyltransferase